MLLNLNAETEPHKTSKLKFAAVIAGGVLFLTIIASLKAGIPVGYHLPAKSNIGLVEIVGQKLFTDFLLPFEVSSILFLSAMIGSVVLAKKEKR
jgi:NADH-quinone oxidoreductase subunit J